MQGTHLTCSQTCSKTTLCLAADNTTVIRHSKVQSYEHIHLIDNSHINGKIYNQYECDQGAKLTLR